MFKDVLNHADMALWAEMGLLIFFAVFIAVCFYAVTRSKRQIEQWSAIPLAAEEQNRE